MWKEIKGFEGHYWVSHLGQIKNKNGHVLKGYKTKKGYQRVGLSLENKVTKYLVHRLVAEAFIENEQNLPQVNHKDMNKQNNNVANLEWVNNQDNVNHAIKNSEGRLNQLKASMSSIGTMYSHKGSEASKKPVIQIDKNTGEIIGRFDSAREASKQTGSNYRNISQVCLGHKKTHNGYKWRFE